MVGMRVKAFLVLTVLVGLARSDFSTQNCRMEPDNSIDKVIEKNQGVKFTCDLDGGTVQVWLQTKHGISDQKFVNPAFLGLQYCTVRITC
jgi:hypothetical protein